MGDASRQNLIPPAGPSMAPTDEELQSQLSHIQMAFNRNWEYKERALKAKVDELQKALDSANAKETKRKAEMEETKKWVVEELKLLLFNEDSKNGTELLKEKLKNAEVVMDNGFRKRAEYRRIIREQKLKISVLETTLEETESGLRKELQVQHDEVQGLQRRLELAQQKTRDYLHQVLLEMEGEADLNREMPVAEGENSGESEDQGQNLEREERIWEWGVLIIWSSQLSQNQQRIRENEEGASSQLVPVPVAASSSNNPQLPRRSTRRRNILDRSKNPAEFYQHGEKRRIKMSYDHVNILGENPPLYQCKKCHRKFKSTRSIYNHMYCQSEDADKPFQCSQCGKGFVHSSNFKYHLKIHSGERPFVCVVCKRGFIQNCNLQSHIKTHTVFSTDDKRKSWAVQEQRPRCMMIGRDRPSETSSMSSVAHSPQHSFERKRERGSVSVFGFWWNGLGSGGVYQSSGRKSEQQLNQAEYFAHAWQVARYQSTGGIGDVGARSEGQITGRGLGSGYGSQSEGGVNFSEGDEALNRQGARSKTTDLLRRLKS
ncbi:putative zinc finger protein [Orchesella cincta]|uniref:Putative zinc finger protein n=1 Tax=Orchesella cincta TaxID=48709 RepID=A0A1D2M5P0_ORCCI|nr:putative zinc finger protein [Orchesella cincta]